MDSIFGLIVCAALAYVLYGPWQHACTDFARQRIFANRDQLFDLAAAGKIGFDSYYYKSVRLSLEQNIRFAHALTLPRVVAYRFALRNTSVNHSEISKTIGRIEDHELRGEVEKILKDSQIALVFMVLMKSPLFLVLLPLICTYYVNNRISSYVASIASKRLNTWGELIQLEAERAPLPRAKTA